MLYILEQLGLNTQHLTFDKERMCIRGRRPYAWGKYTSYYAWHIIDPLLRNNTNWCVSHCKIRTPSQTIKVRGSDTGIERDIIPMSGAVREYYMERPCYIWVYLKRNTT